MGKKSSTFRNTVCGGVANVSLRCRLRSRWKTSQRGDGQRATSLAARDARFGIWGGRRRDRRDGQRLAENAAATIARINLVSRSDRNRHAQLALANIVGGHVGPSPRTQAEYLAGGREPDRFVDLQCGRGG